MAILPQLRTNSAVPLKIPMAIHQIWIQGSSSLPDRYKSTSRTWRDQNAGWDYTLWDDEMLRWFMTREASEWLSLYDKQPENVAKADVARYALLHARGGLYADIDTECVQPVIVMLEQNQATLFIQLYDNLWARRRHPDARYEQLANSVIASRRHIPFGNESGKRLSAPRASGSCLSAQDPVCFGLSSKKASKITRGTFASGTISKY